MMWPLMLDIVHHPHLLPCFSNLLEQHQKDFVAYQMVKVSFHIFT